MWDDGDPRVTHREFTTNTVRIFVLHCPSSLEPTTTRLMSQAHWERMESRTQRREWPTELQSWQMISLMTIKRCPPNSPRISSSCRIIRTALLTSAGIVSSLKGQTSGPSGGHHFYSTNEDYNFGRYDTNSESIDRIAYASRYYLSVWRQATSVALPANRQSARRTGISRFTSILTISTFHPVTRVPTTVARTVRLPASERGGEELPDCRSRQQHRQRVLAVEQCGHVHVQQFRAGRRWTNQARCGRRRCECVFDWFACQR